MTADDTTPDRAAIRANAMFPEEVQRLRDYMGAVPEGQYLLNVNRAELSLLLDGTDALHALLDRPAEVEVRRLRDATTTLIEKAEAGEGVVIYPGHSTFYNVDTGLLRAVLDGGSTESAEPDTSLRDTMLDAMRCDDPRFGGSTEGRQP